MTDFTKVQQIEKQFIQLISQGRIKKKSRISTNDPSQLMKFYKESKFKVISLEGKLLPKLLSIKKWLSSNKEYNPNIKINKMNQTFKKIPNTPLTQISGDLSEVSLKEVKKLINQTKKGKAAVQLPDEKKDKEVQAIIQTLLLSNECDEKTTTINHVCIYFDIKTISGIIWCQKLLYR